MLMKKSVLSIIIGSIISTSVYAATDANGNDVAKNAVTDKDQVANGYKYTSKAGYQSSEESPYDYRYQYDQDANNGEGAFVINYHDPINDKTIELTSQNYPESYLGMDGGNAFTINADNSTGYYEGDLVDGVKIDSTNNSTVIVYKSYTTHAEINNSEKSTMFLDSSNAEGAQIINDSESNMYLLNNIATEAIIQNNNASYMLIKNNDAGSATITNSGNSTIDIVNNAVDDAKITNENGTMTLSGNNATGVHVENKDGGTLTASNNKINTDSTIVNENNGIAYFNDNTVTDASISNQKAIMYLSGNVAKNATVTNNQGNMYIDNNEISEHTTVNNNDATIKATLNTISSSTINSTLGALLLYGNEVDNTEINNAVDSVLVIGDCVAGDENGCTESKNTVVNGSTINSAGTAILSGTVTGSDNIVTNSGLAILDGLTATGSDINNSGMLSLSNDTSSSIGNLTNSGNILLSNNASITNTLTVNGNYVGENGDIIFNGKLNGDDSSTNKLIITGEASGSTSVRVNNQGGSGKPTLEGIELITTGSSASDTFVQKGRIVSGAYDYTLKQGNQNNDADTMNNWYLTSQTANSGGNTSQTHSWRPEAGAYAANLQAANTLFSLTLHDRTGDSIYKDPLTGQIKQTSMWMKNEGGRLSYKMSDGQNKTTANRYILQIGSDIGKWSSNDTDSFRLGLTGGYATQHSTTHNRVTGYDAKGSIHGYSTGIYGTWYQNDTDKMGAYADSWVLYNWFDNSVKGSDLAQESYHSQGFTASVETGYTLPVTSWSSSDGSDNTLFIQPHAQITWMGVKAGNHTESNGTEVSSNGNDNIQTKLGVKTYFTHSSTDKNTYRESRPFIEANWIYNSREYGATMDGLSDYTKGSRNVGEIKVGFDGQIGNGLTMSASIAQKQGGNSYHDTAGQLTVKYNF